MLNKEDKLSILQTSISPYKEYCEGYGNSAAIGNGYLLGIILEIGKANIQFSHEGSQLLDEINAFDLAEVNGTYLGQINMTQVSSFCGPQGLIWGYDIAQTNQLYQQPERLSFPKFTLDPHTNKPIPIYEINPLADALPGLFGTVENKKMHIRPGAHVPCATKNIKMTGPKIIYASLAIGIAKDRKKNACLLMEDVGYIPLDPDANEEKIVRYEDKIRTNLAASVIQIGFNQKVEYEMIFVGVKSVRLHKNEIGCALIACPYFLLAQNAIPKDQAGNLDINQFIESNDISLTYSTNVKH